MCARGQWVWPMLGALAWLGGRSPAMGAPPAADVSPLVQPGSAEQSQRELTLAEARRRIEALRAEVARHDVLYFRQATPEISDRDYDLLRSKLSALVARYPSVAGGLAAGPGDDRTGPFPTWRHRMPMRSLEKTYYESTLRAFVTDLAHRCGRDRPVCVVEPKVDGLAVSAIYDRGRFVRAVTRGNGREGDDITANAGCIRNLPRRLAPTRTGGPGVPDFIELRGEIHLTLAEFERINRKRAAADEPRYASPRNLAAGTVRSMDPAEAENRRLEVVFFDWGACEPASVAPMSQREFYERARAWQVPVIACLWAGKDAGKMCAAVRDFARTRGSLGYPTDGAVVKVDSVALRRRLGETDYAPRWALAFKFEAPRAETRLLGITVQVGRTGLLTPVAELQPVRLGRATVTRASLHNRATIRRLDLRIGDIVIVERAGEIIPAITGVNRARRPASARPYVFPNRCPQCGSTVVQLNGEAAVRCPNSSCPGQVRARLRHFASRSCLDLPGLGPATIDRLVVAGRLKTVADFYRLHRDDLATPGRAPPTSTDRTLAAIERSRHAELWRFINGLGIPRVGAATARKLARQFGSLEALMAATGKDFEPGGRGGGRRGATLLGDAVVAHFAMPQNRTVVADLRGLGVRPVADTDASGSLRAPAPTSVTGAAQSGGAAIYPQIESQGTSAVRIVVQDGGRKTTDGQRSRPVSDR